jgi:hypothetical protein
LPVVPICRRRAALLKTRIMAIIPAVPPRHEGRCASSRTRGGMRWTRSHCQTCNANVDGEGVWSWHPWAGAKPANDDLQATVTNKVMDTGESTFISRNTIAQGRPDVSAMPVVTNSCAYLTAHEAAGAASTRSSLRPLFSRVVRKIARARSCRGNAESHHLHEPPLSPLRYGNMGRYAARAPPSRPKTAPKESLKFR